MYPVLLTIGPLVISSLGLFLSLAFLSAVFIAWRLAKLYDVKEEKILDVAMVTFGGGFLGARLYAVIFNWEAFGSFEKILFVQRYPGLSFWGGLIGKRLPVSLIESLVFLWLFFSLFKQVVKFHFAGKITAVFLIWLGIVKFMTEFYRGDSRQVISPFWVSYGHTFAILALSAGVVIFYIRSKRNVLDDLHNLIKLFSSSKRREVLLSSWKKSWYNHKTAWKVGFGKMSLAIKSLPKKFTRKLN